MPIQRNYHPVDMREALDASQLIQIPIADREVYPLADRDYAGGAALAAYYEALPAYSGRITSSKRVATYSTLPTYSSALKQKTLIRRANLDAYVRDLAPNYSYGYLSSVFINNRTDIADGYYSGLVAFTSFPVGGTVQSATMYIYRPAPVSIYTTYYFNRITSSWTELVTWNTRPTRTGSYSVYMGSEEGWHSFSVLDIVKSWIESGTGQHGIYFDSEVLPAADPQLEFYSREGSADLKAYIIATINY